MKWTQSIRSKPETPVDSHLKTVECPIHLKNHHINFQVEDVFLTQVFGLSFYVLFGGCQVNPRASSSLDQISFSFPGYCLPDSPRQRSSSAERVPQDHLWCFFSWQDQHTTSKQAKQDSLRVPTLLCGPFQRLAACWLLLGFFFSPFTTFNSIFF